MNGNSLIRKTVDGCAFWEYMLPAEKTDSVTVETVIRAEVPGIRRPVVFRTEQGVLFRFPEDGFLPFAEAAERRVPGFARGVLLGVCDAFLSAEEYMLDERTVQTAPDGIFWNTAKQKAELLCLPGLAAEHSPREALQKLCGELGGENASVGDRLCICAVQPALGREEEPVWQALRQTAERIPVSGAGSALLRTKDGAVFPLHPGKNAVGRAEEPLSLHVSDHPNVSRTHAVLEESGGAWKVTDLSLNHSFLNGKMLEKGKSAPLHSGDKLALSTEEFVFVC